MAILTTPTSWGASVVGATGNTGYGNLAANSFYEIRTGNGRARFKGTASVTPNQFAYDVSTNNYYYTNHTGTNFYRFDVDEGTEHLITDLTQAGMPAGKTASGGGDFYNGRYYYTPEAGTDSIYTIGLNPDGTQIQSHSPITPSNLSDFSDLADGSVHAGLGDFGDIAINRETGKMYGSSTMHNNGSSYTAFWAIDLTDPNYTMEMISTDLGSVYQLAFDERNRLWANRWANGPGETRGELVRIRLSNGSIRATKTITLNGNNANGDFYDLASSNIREGTSIAGVPEPSNLCYIVVSSVLCLWRRKRS